jgi:hypothetical protein
MLREWTCGTAMLEGGMPRYAARIFELKARGVRVVRRRCADPAHRHQGTQYQWKEEA